MPSTTTIAYLHPAVQRLIALLAASLLLIAVLPATVLADDAHDRDAPETDLDDADDVDVPRIGWTSEELRLEHAVDDRDPAALDGAELRFGGAEEERFEDGSSAWVLDGRTTPRLHVDAASVPDGVAVDGLVRLELVEVVGPGELTISQVADDGERLGDELLRSDDLDQVARVRTGEGHPTAWSFTAPGEYEITLEVALTRPGGEVARQTAALLVEVGAKEADAPDQPAEDDDDNGRDRGRIVTGDRPAASEEQPTDAPQEPSSDASAEAGRTASVTDAPSSSSSSSSSTTTTPSDDEPSATATTSTGAEGSRVETVDTAQGRLLLDVGHTDAFEVTLDGGDLVLSVKDDTFLHADEIVYRSPSEVLFQARPESATEVPEGDDFAFLGEPGDTVHLLPLTQDPDLLWPGWSTERMSSGNVDGPVQLSITDVQGPGHLKLFTSSTFGGNDVLVDSETGLPDSWNVNVPAHVHANWAFTETGAYTLTVQADATLADGTEVSTGGVEYDWHVGDLSDPGPGGGDDEDDGNGADGNGDGAGGNGDGGSGSDDGGDGTGDGALADTGGEATTLVPVGLLLLVVGFLLVRGARARRVHAPAVP